MQRLILLLLTLLAGPSRYHAQVSSVDSLKQAIASAKQDTAKLKSKLRLAFEYRKLGKDSDAVQLLQQIIKQSVNINFLKTKAEAEYQFGMFYQEKSQYDKSIIYFRESQNTARLANNVRQQADASNSMGVTYYQMTNYDSAIACFSRASSLSIAAKDTVAAAKALNNAGIMSDIKGNQTGAIEHYLKALKLYEQCKREELKPGPLQNIAMILNGRKDYENARKYLSEAEAISEKNQDYSSLTQIYNSIGTSYDDQKNFKEGYRYFTKMLKAAREHNMLKMQAIALTNLGVNLGYQNKPREAIKHLREAIAIKKQLGSAISLGITQITAGGALVEMKNYKEAIPYLEEGLKNIEGSGYLEYEKNAYLSLSTAYEKTNDTRQGLLYIKHYLKLKDSLLNAENSKAISELQTQYETEKKEKEIALLNKTREAQDAEIAREKTLIRSLTGIGVLIFMLLVVVVFALRSKQKANRLLTEKNIQIENQHREIVHQKEIVDEKNKEILDSIRYARRIQTSLLTTEWYIDQALKKLKT